ncbi:MAG: nucleoside deaminase [Planctomycetia bacterium]|nr:nucleoside deaminase [Planctomycetia bacterium]
MLLAIGRAREGIAAGQTPFGCAIALDDEVIGSAHNSVWATTDITAHAEITALRQACSSTRQVHLPGAIVATTCEPCPMCIAALHWARVEAVYYGARIADATAAGFNELHISADDIVRQGGSPIKLVPGILAEECIALFDEWRASSRARVY